MSRRIFVVFAFLLCPFTLRADLVLVQQLATTNRSAILTTRIHDEKMRLDESDNGVGVIVNLKTRDSITLLTNKLYMDKFGSEVHWEMDQERKYFHGTNEMDFPPAKAVDTGKSETVDGTPAEIYTWSGARGVMETMWVATNFPSYQAIRTELAKLDQFNDTGPHRNGQPMLNLLPGMVLKSRSEARGHVITSTLVSVKTESVDPSIFVLPPGYTRWQPKAKANPPPK